MILAVFQHAKAGVNALGLQVDRVRRLRIRFHRHDIGLIRRSKNNQLTEASVKCEVELGFLIQIDKPSDTALSRKHEPGQDVIQFQPLDRLAGAEIQSRIDRLDLARRQEILEGPVFGRREDQSGFLQVAPGPKRDNYSYLGLKLGQILN